MLRVWITKHTDGSTGTIVACSMNHARWSLEPGHFLTGDASPVDPERGDICQSCVTEEEIGDVDEETLDLWDIFHRDAGDRD